MNVTVDRSDNCFQPEDSSSVSRGVVMDVETMGVLATWLILSFQKAEDVPSIYLPLK